MRLIPAKAPAVAEAIFDFYFCDDGTGRKSVEDEISAMWSGDPGSKP